jgi:polar amino acid transport system substrate-binding protein
MQLKRDQVADKLMKRIASVLFALLCLSATAGEIPDFFGVRETSSAQTAPPLNGLQFVAALDNPPFSFLDDSTRLNGFSVYLARAVCEELNTTGNCTISGQMSAALAQNSNNDPVNIIISNIDASSETRDKYRFTKPFLRIPGRFVSRKDGATSFDFETGLPGARIGVVANSREERMLRSYFPAAASTGYANRALLLADLSGGKIELAFGGGLDLATWLLSEDGRSCCSFAGGPYYSSHFLGEGVRFAVPAAKGSLVDQIDQALVSLQQSGKIEELFLRFFPVNFY